MREPEEVSAMLRLHGNGWGTRRIARELGVSRNTVKRWLAEGGWVAYRRPERVACLGGLEEWLKERFQRHRGNAEASRQELAGEQGIAVSLRTVERAVEPWRRELLAEARATVRFETAPGEQLQIDFGQMRAPIADEQVRVHLCVATLGYSRRNFAMAFDNQRQGSWLRGIEAAFAHFGGVPRHLLLDNARALVDSHDVETREVQYNERFHAFCRDWGVRPKACAPYRARYPKARTRTAWGTSRATPSPGVALRAGRRWRPTCRRGCARLPTCASTAAPASARSTAFAPPRPARSSPWTASPRSSSSAS
jgi:transposase